MRIHIDQDTCIESDYVHQNVLMFVKCYQLGGASDEEVDEPL
jgi:hypothetical protein